MTRMLGLEVPYYLGHEGKNFSGGKSKSNVFKFIKLFITGFFSDGFPLPASLTLKVILLEPISHVLKSIIIFELSPELIVSQTTLYSTL